MTWNFYAFQLELISFRFKNAATFLSRMDLMYWFYDQGKDGQFEKTFPSASTTTNEGMGIRNHKNTSKAEEKGSPELIRHSWRSILRPSTNCTFQSFNTCCILDGSVHPVTPTNSSNIFFLHPYLRKLEINKHQLLHVVSPIGHGTVLLHFNTEFRSCQWRNVNLQCPLHKTNAPKCCIHWQMFATVRQTNLQSTWPHRKSSACNRSNELKLCQ